ncbi:hypothetical protein [Paludibacterium yongneupense]|uniref:hypothetical protein n=1 Tax=Paludibacterium yongneupense TaxID=400061 RepID=UPI0003F9935D|nr:hypothetical protein [Paludibacterium yongneupense]
MTDLLDFFTSRVQSQYFSGFPIYQSAEGAFYGEYMKIRLFSRFDELGDGQALASLVGLTALGTPIEPATLYRLSPTSQSAAVLDRFIRSIHLLNFLQQPTRYQPLYLGVSSALIDEVHGEHGRTFRDILQRLDLDGHPFGIVLPDELAAAPARRRQIAANYRRHGFLVAVYDAAGGIAPLAE